MTFVKPIFCAAALALSTFSAEAAIVDGASFGNPALGELNYNATFNAPTTHLFNIQTTGVLDSFTMWIDTASNFFSAGEDLVFTVMADGGPFPDVDDELARITLLGTDLLAGPEIAGGGGQTYVAATWDMSGLNILAEEDDVFGFRLFASGPSGQVMFNGSNCNNGANTLACDADLGLSRFVGTQTMRGNTGSPADVGTFALTVDDGQTVAPVPLPAGLPLMLLGLGTFALIRRR